MIVVKTTWARTMAQRLQTFKYFKFANSSFATTTIRGPHSFLPSNRRAGQLFSRLSFSPRNAKMPSIRLSINPFHFSSWHLSFGVNDSPRKRERGRGRDSCFSVSGKISSNIRLILTFHPAERIFILFMIIVNDKLVISHFFPSHSQ